MKWKNIPKFNGRYCISDNGIVNSKNPHRGNIILKPTPDKDSYYHVRLYKEKKSYCCRVHRLVALTFIRKIKHCNVVNHIDSNIKNNDVKNLEWTTIVGNNRDLYYKKRNSRYGAPLEINTIRKMRHDFANGMLIRDIALKYGKKRNATRCIVRYLTWKDV